MAARGEIYWARVPSEHTVGREQFKRRPWIIVSSDLLHRSGLQLVIAVPLTTNITIQGGFRKFRVQIPPGKVRTAPGAAQPLDPGITRVALTEQVRVLSVERLDGAPVASVSDDVLFAIEAGLKFVMDLA